MLPTGFPFTLTSNLMAAQHLQQLQQQQILFAQSRAAGVMPQPPSLSSMTVIPLPTSAPAAAVAAAAARPSPMLVPPGMGVDDSTSSPMNPDSEWTEHKHTDGRIYYHNRVTKQSSWVKPDSLKTPQEKAASQPIWREYQAENGKSYYYNVLTKETTWTKPENGEITKHDSTKQHASTSLTATSSSTATPKETIKEKKEETEMEKAMKATLASMPNVPLPTERKNDEQPVNDEAELKKRQAERFRELLRDKYNSGKITTTCNWDHAVRWIQNDPRFRILNKVSEKKQLFNAWKVQRQKEERDEKRLAIKKAKEDLEKMLQDHPKMKETLKYSRACEIFGKDPLWQAVHDDDRLEIFRDCLEFVAKRDRERRKEVQDRNIQALSQILQSMEQITYKTTWAQAQRLLIENPQFAGDTTLQHMDKEDALVVFEEHIKNAEKEHEAEKEQEERRCRRQERKVRENFQVLLHELHKKGELTSISLWSSLYPVISTDSRFDAMLLQTGSTPLDLFKFFVEDLKNQYVEDRKTIKEILNEKELQVTATTEYEQFSEWVTAHPDGAKVDHGNMKLCYNSLVEKAESKAKEEEREVARKKRRLESEYRNLLKALNVDVETEWSTLKGKIEKEKAFLALENEEECEKCFNEYKTSLAEACQHVHGTAGEKKDKKKKKEKKKKSKRSDKESESEGEIREKKKKKKHTRERDERSDSEERGKKSKKSRKRSRSRTISEGSQKYEEDKRRRHDISDSE